MAGIYTLVVGIDRYDEKTGTLVAKNMNIFIELDKDPKDEEFYSEWFPDPTSTTPEHQLDIKILQACKRIVEERDDFDPNFPWRIVEAVDCKLKKAKRHQLPRNYVVSLAIDSDHGTCERIK
jgi:hypothetical protein